MLPPDKHTCTTCRKNKKPGSLKLGVWGGILLALLPKCPFCVVAYSGTIMLCSKNSVTVLNETNTSFVTVFLTGVFCLLAIAGIWFNKRGARTTYAMWMSVAGTAMVMTSVLLFGGLALYYGGVAVLFAGVWLNGSLLYFINRGKHFFSNTATKQPAKESF